MISNLILAIGIVGATAIQPNDPTTHINNAVTSYDYEYQYQTNEVNSIDDLIVGNIYHMSNNNKDDYLLLDNMQENNKELDGIAYNIEINSENITDTFDEILWDTEENIRNNYIQLTPSYVWQGIRTNAYDPNYGYNYVFSYIEFSSTQDFISCNLVIDENNKQIIEELWDYAEGHNITWENFNYFSQSTYLGEIIQTETTTNGLYNSIEEFIEEYIFNNDKLKETEYTIMGATYNMAEWLAHTTTIVLMCVILFVLVYFVKWLFKQIGNTFNLVGAY